MAASLFFTCPSTHDRAPSGIQTDAATLSVTWSKKLTVKCPSCGKTHDLSVRDTYLDSALYEAVGRYKNPTR